MGHPGPQVPHLPCPPTCIPLLSTKVEHQALWSVKWALFHMHVLYDNPLNLKGKMQETFGVAPPTVMHKVLLSSSISV